MTDADFELLTTDTDKFMRDRGYFTLKDFANQNNISEGRVRTLLAQNNLDAVKVGLKLYISYSETYRRRRNPLTAPDGYISVPDIAKKWFMTPQNVHNMIRKGKLTGVIRRGKTCYLPINTPIPTFRLDSKKPPKGYITPRELSRRWHFTTSYVHWMIKAGNVPGSIVIDGRIYIPENVKMPEHRATISKKGEAV